ncbi:MAG: helix-turn-helix domain-containing protein [Elusimicrobiota bacterium]
MSRGRPPLGPKLVDRLEGSEHAKERLKILLETLNGEKTIEQACEELTIGEAMFHKLRSRFLQEAVESLEPRPVGRPRQEVDEAEKVRAEYERHLAELEIDLQAARVREEIALAMPHLLQPKRREQQAKKGGPRASRKKRGH